MTFDRPTLEGELRAAGAVIHGRDVQCPYHDDAHASGTLYETGDGHWRFKCLACGVCDDAAGLAARRTGKPATAFLTQGASEYVPPPQSPATGSGGAPDSIPTYRTREALANAVSTVRGAIQAIYEYGGRLLVFRCARPDGGKTFVQCSPAPGGGWRMKGADKPWPLYRPPTPDEPDVLIEEGEKCVEATRALGIPATCSPGGAQNAKSADWSALAGKRVWIWPDNDAPGQQYAEDVAVILANLMPPASVVTLPVPPELFEHGDVADWLELHRAQDGWNDQQCAEALTLMLDANPHPRNANTLHDRLLETIAGTRRAIDWPWPLTTTLTRALRPGAVVLLVGSPGAGKSFFMLQSLIFWLGGGIPVAVLCLEEERSYHEHRILAMLSSNQWLTDDRWVSAHGPETLELEQRYAEHLTRVSACLSEHPAVGMMSYEAVLKWCEAKAKDGARIVAVDPITKADTNERVWIADKKLMVELQRIATSYRCSIVIVSHETKGAQGFTTTAGGAAFERFSQCHLKLINHEQRTEWIMQQGEIGYEPVPCEINRTLYLKKTRDGSGSETKIGMYWNDNTMQFEEVGKIQIRKQKFERKGF